MTTQNFARKKLTCAAYRNFETGDSKDKQFTDGGPMPLSASYHVYYGATPVVSGWKEYAEFTVP